MSSVVPMKGLRTTLDIPVDTVLEGARNARYRHVLVLGEGEDGRIHVRASAGAASYSLLMLELAKRVILDWVEGL